MKTPYRKAELTCNTNFKESGNFFCKSFGCRIKKQTIPTGIYLLDSIKDDIIFSFQNCEICGREFAKHFTQNEFIQLTHNENFTKWFFIKFDCKPDDIMLLTKNNEEDEYIAEIRYISSISEIKNLEYKHLKFKYICSNIGCKYKIYTDQYGIPLLKKCLRCEKII
jgi:hypothetical protein